MKTNQMTELSFNELESTNGSVAIFLAGRVAGAAIGYFVAKYF